MQSGHTEPNQSKIVQMFALQAMVRNLLIVEGEHVLAYQQDFGLKPPHELTVSHHFTHCVPSLEAIRQARHSTVTRS